MSDYDFARSVRDSWERLLEKLGGEDRVKSTLHRRLDPIAGVRRGSLAADKQGVDFWADRPGAKSLGIDVKLRERDHDDLLIEFESNSTSHALGWTVDPAKITDYVLYLWPSDEVLLSFPQLRAATIENLPTWVDSYRESANRTTSNNGEYRTRWVAVPDRVVYAAMGYRVTGLGRVLSVTAPAGPGPHCPECGGAPLAQEPQALDPGFVRFRCANRHKWVGRAA